MTRKEMHKIICLRVLTRRKFCNVGKRKAKDRFFELSETAR